MVKKETISSAQTLWNLMEVTFELVLLIRIEAKIWSNKRALLVQISLKKCKSFTCYRLSHRGTWLDLLFQYDEPEFQKIVGINFIEDLAKINKQVRTENKTPSETPKIFQARIKTVLIWNQNSSWKTDEQFFSTKVSYISLQFCNSLFGNFWWNL